MAGHIPPTLPLPGSRARTSMMPPVKQNLPQPCTMPDAYGFVRLTISTKPFLSSADMKLVGSYAVVMFSAPPLVVTWLAL